MEKRSFKPPNALILPIGPAMVAAAGLIFVESGSDKGILLGLILAPFYYLGLEILFRRINVSEKGLEVVKLLRKTSVEWSDVKSLDAVRSGTRIFIIVQSESAIPLIISNTISDFKELSNIILNNVPDHRIDRSVYETLEDPPLNNRPIFQAWVVFMVLASVLAFRLFLG
jgi:hypothetical protein